MIRLKKYLFIFINLGYPPKSINLSGGLRNLEASDARGLNPQGKKIIRSISFESN